VLLVWLESCLSLVSIVCCCVCVVVCVCCRRGLRPTTLGRPRAVCAPRGRTLLELVSRGAGRVLWALSLPCPALRGAPLVLWGGTRLCLGRAAARRARFVFSLLVGFLVGLLA
jgi:hypothetical protein